MLGQSLLADDEQNYRSRLNSRYFRELTHGRFLIKYEHLSQLENIGQGKSVLSTSSDMQLILL